MEEQAAPAKSCCGVVWTIGGASYFNELELGTRFLRQDSSLRGTVFTVREDMRVCGSTTSGLAADGRGELSCYAADVQFASEDATLGATARAAGRRRASAHAILSRYWRERAGRPRPIFNKETSRYLKITAFVASPYNQSLFLDTDAVPCASQATLFGYAGFRQVFDFQLAITHIATVRLVAGSRDQKLFDRFHVPYSFPEVNSGVVFFQPLKAGVQEVFAEWVHIYRDGDYRRLANPFRGRGVGAADQQALTIALYRGIASGLVGMNTLGSIWNFGHFRQDLLYPPRRDCCSNTSRKWSVVVDHMCGMNDHRRLRV